MALFQRFINSSATTSRAAEFTGFYNTVTNWDRGPNNCASNAVGIGIGTQTNLQAAPGLSLVPQQSGWTLNDQAGIARTAAAGNQKSQVIGGTGYVARSGNVATTWDRTQALYTPQGAASSGGLEGAGSQATQLVFLVTNPNNITVNNMSVPDPDVPAPTVVGSAQLATLAAGWVAV
jgi:hypothetical protein